MENNVRGWGEAFTSSLQDVWNQIMAFLPELIAAIVIFIIGYLIAKALGTLTARLFKFLKVDHFAQSIGMTKEIEDFGVKYSIANIFGMIVKWFFIVVTLIAVVDVLNITQVTNFLERLLLYLPNVFVAVLILILGMIVGRMVYNFLHKAMDTISLPNATIKILASVAKWAIFIFALMAAFVQLGIAQSLIQMLFAGFVVMISLAGGLAFGLGGREHASRLLTSIEKSFQKKSDRDF